MATITWFSDTISYLDFNKYAYLCVLVSGDWYNIYLNCRMKLNII